MSPGCESTMGRLFTRYKCVCVCMCVCLWSTHYCLILEQKHGGGIHKAGTFTVAFDVVAIESINIAFEQSNL